MISLEEITWWSYNDSAILSEAHLINYQRSPFHPTVHKQFYGQLTIHHVPFNKDSLWWNVKRGEEKKKINLANVRKLSINFVFQTEPPV